MKDPDSELLSRLAADFRIALESYLLERPGLPLSTDPLFPLARFPKGHCKASAFLLGLYLRSIAWPARLSYVWGFRDAQSHGWLEVDQLFIDLTGDQFPDQDRPVIVEKAAESEWHTTFAPYQRSLIEVRAGHTFHAVAAELSRRMAPPSRSTF